MWQEFRFNRSHAESFTHDSSFSTPLAIAFDGEGTLARS
jgi:hypothetical protein